jgi:hypothetical protein
VGDRRDLDQVRMAPDRLFKTMDGCAHRLRRLGLFIVWE